MALLVSGNSSISAKAILVDEVSGEKSKEFLCFAQIPCLGGILGAIRTATINAIEDEKRLIRMLAEDLIKRIYGTEFSEKVINREPSKKARPNYPMTSKAAAEK